MLNIGTPSRCVYITEIVQAVILVGDVLQWLDTSHYIVHILQPVHFEARISRHSVELCAHGHHTNNLPAKLLWQ